VQFVSNFFFSQDQTGDIYYFNFSTGESVWDHPRDDFYRNRVFEERQRRSAMGQTSTEKDNHKEKEDDDEKKKTLEKRKDPKREERNQEELDRTEDHSMTAQENASEPKAEDSPDEGIDHIDDPELIPACEAGGTVKPQPPFRMSTNDETELSKTTPKSTKKPASLKLSPSEFSEKKREDRELEVLEGLTQSLNEPSDENTEIDSFCQYISKCLKKFDQRTQSIVKNEIQNLIFQAEMGNATPTPITGSVAPLAPQLVYHQHVQPPHVHNPLASEES